MEIDVCVPTRTSLPDWWMENVNRLPLNKLHVDTSKPLGLARQKLINKVETDWFAFIDDDVLIGENWYDTVTSHIADDVGAVDGREQYIGFGEKFTRALNEYRWSFPDKQLNLGDRGRTVSTLLRTDAVRDWQPSRPDLSSWEDYELTTHVIKEGYRWLDVKAPALHYGWSLFNVAWKSLWHCEGVKRVQRSERFRLHKYMFRLAMYPPLIMIKSLLRVKPRVWYNFHIAAYSAWQNFWLIWGLLRK